MKALTRNFAIALVALVVVGAVSEAHARWGHGHHYGFRTVRIYRPYVRYVSPPRMIVPPTYQPPLVTPPITQYPPQQIPQKQFPPSQYGGYGGGYNANLSSGYNTSVGGGYGGGQFTPKQGGKWAPQQLYR